MGSSHLRQLRRHSWCAKTITRNVRRIPELTVWVSGVGVLDSTSIRGVKANEGAEKSCLRTRRSRRGLRRGRCRSRGRKPRSPSTPLQPSTEKVTSRKVNRLLRQFAYWEKKWDVLTARGRSELARHSRGPHGVVDGLWLLSKSQYVKGGTRTNPGPAYYRKSFRRGIVLQRLYVDYRKLRKGTLVHCPPFNPMGWAVWLDHLPFSYESIAGEQATSAWNLEELALRAGEAALEHREALKKTEASSKEPSRPEKPRSKNGRGERKHIPAKESPPRQSRPKGNGPPTQADFDRLFGGL